MKAIILAAGKGTRLHKFTQGKPKCMLKLGNETILEREIRLLIENGFERNDIYVVGGYRYEDLKEVSPNLIINTDYENKDNSYSLALGLNEVDDDVLILDADLCFESGLIRQILEDTRENIVMSKKSDDLSESTGIVTTEDYRVSAIGKQYLNTGYVYISIFKISRKIIKDFRKKLLSERNGRTWYTQALTELCSVYDFYNLPVYGKWHEIDFEEDYFETLELFELR